MGEGREGEDKGALQIGLLKWISPSPFALYLGVADDGRYGGWSGERVKERVGLGEVGEPVGFLFLTV